MKRSLLAVLFALVPAMALAADPAFYSASPLTIHVSTTGSDFTGAINNSAKPFKSIKAALSVIPDGFIAPVILEMGSGTFVLPDMSFTLHPGSTASGGSHQIGSVSIRGACTAADTWTTSTTWALVSGKKSQVTGNIGSYAATVTNGSHIVRYGSSPYSYKAVRTSSSPNLITVDFATSTYAGTLCAYATTLSGSTTFDGSIDAENVPVVTFEAVTFSGSPALRGVRLKGSKLAAPGSLTDVQIVASSLGAAATVHGVTPGLTDWQLSLSTGCLRMDGSIRRFSGVVDATCTAARSGQLHIGSTTVNFDGGTVDAPDAITSIVLESVDFIGDGTCLAGESARIRLGNGAATDDMTCAPAAAGSAFNIRNGSRFGFFDARSTLTGAVFGKSPVRSGSHLGPLHGGFILQDAGILVGVTDGAVLQYPGAVDTSEGVHTVQHTVP